jgi:type IV secretion system protein VirB9
MRRILPIIVAFLLHASPKELNGVSGDLGKPATVAADYQPRSAPQLASPRNIEYQPDDIPVINTKIRYATIVILPASERIIETVCGDKDWWQISAVENLIYIKPTKANIATDLTVLGKSGTLYTFALHEITEAPNTRPDIKLTVHWPESMQRTVTQNGPRFVSKAEHDSIVQDYQQQLQAAVQSVREVQTAAKNVLQEQVTKMRTDYPAELEFDYDISLHTRPFLVRAMYADRRFTYIKLDAAEAPAVYEIKDGKANLVAFDYVNGTFIVRKVVDQGYLAIGKAKLHFHKRQRQ